MDGGDTPERIALEIVEALVLFPDVVEPSSGSFGTLSTAARGGRISGVAVREDHIEVGVVVRYGRPLPEIATEIRRGLAPLTGGRGVHVSVEDVVAGLGDDVDPPG